MSWFTDLPPTVQYAVAFAVIFVLLGALALVARRLLVGGAVPEARAEPDGRSARLGIVDVYEMDRNRRLILLRRDNVEHLLLVGGPNDVVIESEIRRVPVTRVEERPQVTPAPVRPELAQPVSTVRPQIRQAPRTEPTVPKGQETGAEAGGGRPRVPDLEIPVDAVRGDPKLEAAKAAAPEAETAVQDKAGQQGRALNPDTLSSLARQLEETISTLPGSGAPPAGKTEPTVPAKEGEGAVKSVVPFEPKVTGKDGEGQQAATKGRFSLLGPKQGEPAKGEAAKAETAPSAPAKDDAAIESVLEGPKTEVATKPGQSPFSVEEIEVEFARLLGRPVDKRG